MSLSIVIIRPLVPGTVEDQVSKATGYKSQCIEINVADQEWSAWIEITDDGRTSHHTSEAYKACFHAGLIAS